jgi:hypothetical protein
MRRTVEVYALAVCFFTMACLALATGNMLWNLVKLAMPAVTISEHEYKVHKSDDAFAQHVKRQHSYDYATLIGATDAQTGRLAAALALEKMTLLR